MFYLIESTDKQQIITLQCDTETCTPSEKKQAEAIILHDAKQEFTSAGIDNEGSKLKRFKTIRGLKAHLAKGQNPIKTNDYAEEKSDGGSIQGGKD